MNTIEQKIKDFIRYWLFPYLKPRHFHVFGVGTPKSGTHSLEAVFTRHYRTWHEPELERFMRIIVARADGTVSEDGTRKQLCHLDRSKWLELNSSWLNYALLDLLLEEFPRARFVLTIRDCYSWLDSIFNHLLARDQAEFQQRFHQWYAESLGTGEHQEGDQVLAEHGLFPLDGFLRFWSEHNTRVLEMVPDDRLLVVRTQDIRQDIPKMAQFLGIPADTLDAGRSHEYKAEGKFGLLSELDPDYLQACVDARCKDLMHRFFPEIRQLSDVRGYRPEDAPAQAS